MKFEEYVDNGPEKSWLNFGGLALVHLLLTSDDNGDCLEGEGENYQVCSVQCVCNNSAQCNAHTHEQRRNPMRNTISQNNRHCDGDAIVFRAPLSDSNVQ